MYTDHGLSISLSILKMGNIISYKKWSNRIRYDVPSTINFFLKSQNDYCLSGNF